MELIDIVNKLTGPIDPVGETNADNERLDNLKAMIGLVGTLHEQIAEVSEYKDRVEYSMKRAGETANGYLEFIGEDLEERGC